MGEIVITPAFRVQAAKEVRSSLMMPLPAVITSYFLDQQSYLASNCVASDQPPVVIAGFDETWIRQRGPSWGVYALLNAARVQQGVLLENQRFVSYITDVYAHIINPTKQGGVGFSAKDAETIAQSSFSDLTLAFEPVHLFGSRYLKTYGTERRTRESIIQQNQITFKRSIDQGVPVCVSVDDNAYIAGGLNQRHGLVVVGYRGIDNLDVLIIDPLRGPVWISIDHLSQSIVDNSQNNFRLRFGNKSSQTN